MSYKFSIDQKKESTEEMEIFFHLEISESGYLHIMANGCQIARVSSRTGALLIGTIPPEVDLPEDHDGYWCHF